MLTGFLIIVACMLGVVAFEFVAYLWRRLYKQWLTARRARKAAWDPPVINAAFFWEREYEKDGRTRTRRSYETDLESAINNAHEASLERGDWPSSAMVWIVEHGKEPRLAYGPCEDCGYCSYKDRTGVCLPCGVAKRTYPMHPAKCRELSRRLSQANYPKWCGPDTSVESAMQQPTGGMFDDMDIPCGFVPPTPGYAACTRNKGHDGPCAHPLASVVGEEVKDDGEATEGSSQASDQV
jgi:hypothetical protein